MANRRGMVTGAKLERIGEAIREKTGSASQYTLDDMPDAIRNITTGGDSEAEVIIIQSLEIGEGIIRGFEIPVEVQEV